VSDRRPLEPTPEQLDAIEALVRDDTGSGLEGETRRRIFACVRDAVLEAAVSACRETMGYDADGWPKIRDTPDRAANACIEAIEALRGTL
jgi:hypothetical protein